MTTLTRENRIANLKDKIVITAYSRKRGCMLYYQDPSLTYNPKYKWTQFKSNAIGFSTIQEARDYMATQTTTINYNLEVF